MNDRLFVFLALLLLVANWAVWQEVALFHDQSLRVVFFDVGQGDAILIETPERHLILIDGGPADDFLEKVGRFLPFWRRRIDLVVLTHPHADHFIGLVGVLERYRVDRVLWSGVECVEAVCQLWDKALAASDSSVIIARAGQRIQSESTYLDVLYPLESRHRYLPRDHNDISVVTRLAYGRHGFLFTGDATARTEQEMLPAWGDYLKSDILKVAHHGSRFSTQPDLLAAVQPGLAVIQVGSDNRYGHPAQEVLDRLAAHAVDVRRTDHHGDIEVISNGLSYYYE